MCTAAVTCAYFRAGLDMFFLFFFFNDTATTEIYTLSLHDALPISLAQGRKEVRQGGRTGVPVAAAIVMQPPNREGDRKSTRLNSSHGYISYAVFCLKKKKKHRIIADHVGAVGLDILQLHAMAQHVS